MAFHYNQDINMLFLATRITSESEPHYIHYFHIDNNGMIRNDERRILHTHHRDISFMTFDHAHEILWTGCRGGYVNGQTVEMFVPDTSRQDGNVLTRAKSPGVDT